ncbi:TetR/AcrR family transcriptional regulator [Clostridium sp. chh4-2]|uniref:TetR family transcriptional regulator n=1 Tax=Clostridium sp. chh4-2 TaxID=2067550 RepID=UPI000CCF1E74|nr:TetR family transcriptional regulator [Clostridium sp. chh4-2]PNV62627.1 TetR/AcrR family transcriptional regulator [Clostridium sp. chh4-2]
MPTQRFYNLSENKRAVIKMAAIHEFSRALYADASINKIIKEAGISRGSFYTYFEDKSDLLRYLMEDFQSECKGVIWKSLVLSKGDIFEAAEHLTWDLIENGKSRKNFQFYKNVLFDYHLATDTVTFRQKGFIHNSQEYMAFLTECFEKVDRQKYLITDIKKLGYLTELIIIIAIKTITSCYMQIAAPEDAKKVYREQMEIVKHGVER